jgi:hypothetical protein
LKKRGRKKDQQCDITEKRHGSTNLARAKNEKEKGVAFITTQTSFLILSPLGWMASLI